MSSKIPIAISFTGVVNFLGVAGVIGSLIFVALELRQSQRIALAAQQQARTAMITVHCAYPSWIGVCHIS